MDPSKTLGIEHWRRFYDIHAENVVVAAGKIAFIIIAYIIVRFIVFKLIRGLLNSKFAKASEDMLNARKARIRALQSVIMSTVGFVMVFIVAIMILQAAGVNIVPLLTTASVAGLAIGFGAQKLVKDVISGFFILIEDQYGVGDFITIGAVTGTVEDLEMRTTRIRDASGKLFILSNGDISQVCNHSRGELSIIINLAIAASADLSKARRVLDEVGLGMAKDYPKQVKEPFKCDGLTGITGAATTLRITGVVLPCEQENMRVEFNSRAREALNEAGIGLA